MKYMTINNRKVAFDDEKNVLSVIRKAGINLPTFCYHSELSTYGACRMCVVEDDRGKIFASCSEVPRDGMVIYTNTPKLQHHRKMILELMLSAHCRECTTCKKNGDCTLQNLAKQLGVSYIRFENNKPQIPIDESSDCIVIDKNKCILCGDCVRTCEEIQGLGILDFAYRGSKMQVMPAFDRKMAETACVGCGQCRVVCPTGAITIKHNIHPVWEALADKNTRVVVQIAPAVRVAVGDKFGIPKGENSLGKLVAALRRMGFDEIYDTDFGADLTIMEEGSELLSRILKGTGPLPQFTSCCPAWVKYMENFHPDKTAHLSSAKSPIGMQGAVIKTYFAHKKHIDPEKIISVAVTPCTAKKAEIAREELCDAGKLLNIEEMRDNDYVITTKELVQWCKEEGMDLGKITPSKYDSVLGEGTGAGMIFGNTGGVMEAALRTVYRVLEGKEAPADFYQLRPVRGLNNRKEAEVTIAGKNLRVCILYGTAAAEEFLAEDMSGYHFVEVMTCPGGCISGAGQPDCGSVPVSDAVRKKRIASLYQADERAQYRNSMDNPEIGMIYNEFFKEPLSLLSETLLHTTYKSK